MSDQETRDLERLVLSGDASALERLKVAWLRQRVDEEVNGDLEAACRKLLGDGATSPQGYSMIATVTLTLIAAQGTNWMLQRKDLAVSHGGGPYFSLERERWRPPWNLDG